VDGKRAIGSKKCSPKDDFGIGFVVGMFICGGCLGNLMSRGDKASITVLGEFVVSIDHREHSLEASAVLLIGYSCPRHNFASTSHSLTPENM
jgi:hypothetical protein